MEAIGLLIFYGVVLVVLLVGLVFCVKRGKRKHWFVLCASSSILAVLAMRLARYFDALPIQGGSPFSGLAYFAEVFYSMGAAIVYGGITVIVLLCWVLCEIWKIVEKHKNH